MLQYKYTHDEPTPIFIKTILLFIFQEAINSENVMVQYHALGVLYHIRKSDRLAVTKLVAKLTRMSLKSPYAVCMLIRIVCKLLEEEDANGHYFIILRFVSISAFLILQYYN